MESQQLLGGFSQVFHFFQFYRCIFVQLVRIFHYGIKILSKKKTCYTIWWEVKIEYPLPTQEKNPPKSSKRPWLTTKSPQLGLFLGGRGSGKSEAVMYTAEKFRKAGLTIIHPFSAPQENLYWAVNKNCKDVWDKWRVENEKLPQDQRLPEQLHCNCHKAYPILLMVPDYIEFEEYTIDRYNGVYFKDREEYREAYNRGLVEAIEHKFSDPPIEWQKIKKPNALIPTPLIVVKKFTCPTTLQRQLIFAEQFENGVLQARQEHRILVLNPYFFDTPKDLFDTEAEIFKVIKNIMLKHFRKLTPELVAQMRRVKNPVPESEWTKYERHWHKAVLVVNEVRALAPSSRLSGDKESTPSKRTLFALIPIIRHLRLWGLFDYQQNEDLFVGIRNLANWVVIKKANDLILGEDWKWFTMKLTKDIEKIIKFRYRGVMSQEVMRQVKKIRPRIEELPVDHGYITWYDGSYILKKFLTPSFHHKNELEDFSGDTGIEWTVKKKERISAEGKTVAKEVTGKRKKEKDIVMSRVDQFREVDKLTMKQIVEKMAELEKDGLVPAWDFANMKPKALNNSYNTWLAKKGMQKK